MSFGNDLERFAQRANHNAVELKRNVAIACFSSVIKMSPVGNPDLWKPVGQKAGPEGYVGGRFRANWNCSLNSIDRGTTEETDKSGSGTISKMVQACKDADANDSVFLTNSLPYASRLEYKGHSSQAPKGMVRLTVARFRRIIKQQLSRLS